MATRVCGSCGYDFSSVSGLNQTRFCPQCGERVGPAQPSTQTESPGGVLDNPQARGICPKCGLTDQVRNVGTVIDSETSSTSGIGGGVGTGGLGIGGGFSGSQTKLSARLEPPLPNFGCLNALLIGMAVPLGLGFLLQALGAPEVVSLLVGGLGFVVGVPLAWRWIKKRRHQARSLEGYSEALMRLRSAYYCYRDDLIFDGELSGPPLAVKKHFFG
jgi:uncharacterized membrane protein YfcA